MKLSMKVQKNLKKVFPIINMSWQYLNLSMIICFCWQTQWCCVNIVHFWKWCLKDLGCGGKCGRWQLTFSQNSLNFVFSLYKSKINAIQPEMKRSDRMAIRFNPCLCVLFRKLSKHLFLPTLRCRRGLEKLEVFLIIVFDLVLFKSIWIDIHIEVDKPVMWCEYV